MREEEVRWISRDEFGDSLIEVWRTKPKKVGMAYVHLRKLDSTGRISDNISEYLDEKIKRGDLLKVTIEGHY